MIHRKWFLFFLVLLITGCQYQNSENDSGKSEELLVAGDSLTAYAQKVLGNQLKQAIQEGGPVYAVEFCNTAALQIMDTITTGYSLKRTALRVRNPADAPTFQEREILISYQDQLAAGKTPQSEIHDLGDGQMLYTKPILLDNPLCLNCHGTPNEQIAPETYLKIRELYPHDEAVGFEMGELRGMWSLYSQEVKKSRSQKVKKSSPPERLKSFSRACQSCVQAGG